MPVGRLIGGGGLQAIRIVVPIFIHENLVLLLYLCKQVLIFPLFLKELHLEVVFDGLPSALFCLLIR